MTYRLAKSLDVLREQIDSQAPDRAKASDGWIGDAAHQSRDSDHNPWVKIKGGKEKGMGIVTALDITHDRLHGVDCGVIAQQIIDSQDPRVKYLIWNSRICAGPDGPKPWTWRAYGGSNPHNKHMHVSVEDEADAFDNAAKWAIHLKAPEDAAPEQPPRVTLRKGSRGEDVKLLQSLLTLRYYKIEIDGNFGPATDKAVRHFQKSSGLVGDGIVGPYTWEKLES